MLELKNINISLGTFAICDVNLTIEQGDYFVLAGPSGAGKTILLETIAGIYQATTGQIFLDGKEISGLPTGKRGIGLVFQDNTVFPHLSVKENIRFALKRWIQKKVEIESELFKLAEQLGIVHLLNRRPSTLSGGELQRVVLARTMASKPKILLLDEPLSSVDTTGKDHLKALLRDLNRQGQTIVHVTHDFEEAVSLATKVGIMHSGRIVEQGTVETVFYSPRNEFTARFCGYRNFFYALPDDDDYVKIVQDFRVRLDNYPNDFKKIALLIPEESIQISLPPFNGKIENTFQGKIYDISRNKSGFSIEVDAGVRLFVHVNPLIFLDIRFSIGANVWIHLKSNEIKIIKIN
jgi:ABC-type Fe3+/spermidine/putrescine transport system ATPase subunit